jgi:CRISPR-associated protein Cas5h
LAGLIAAILGLEKDSYYEEFSMERAQIGVALRTPVRKLMQTVNYVRTKGLEEVAGSGGPTQIPVEFVLPAHGDQLLRYQVYFSHKEEDLVREVYDKLLKGHHHYPLYMGLTECPAWAENPRLVVEHEMKVLESPEMPLPISTVLPTERLVGDQLRLREGLRLYKDRIPLDFNPDRTLKAAAEVLWEANGRLFEIHVNGRAIQLEEEAVVFLEKTPAV